MSLSAGEHYMAVSKMLGHASYVTTLTVYADYITEGDGGKAAPLRRPDRLNWGCFGKRRSMRIAVFGVRRAMATQNPFPAEAGSADVASNAQRMF